MEAEEKELFHGVKGTGKEERQRDERGSADAPE